MDSYQGLIGRKLLPDIGQAMSVAGGSSSPPPPLYGNPEMKPITALIAFAVAVFFLVLFLSIQFRRWYTYRGRSGHVITASYNPSGPAQGLDVSILETLPKIIFSSASFQSQQKKEKKKQAMECAICLEEFEDQETLRLLPQCGHAFHLECINMWFFSHTTCPLCRHSLLHPNTVAIAVASPNEASIAALNSVPTEEALQMRVAGNPSEEGELLEESSHAELRRSHSMGHSIAKAGLKLPASTSPSLRSFTVHRSISCTVLSDLWRGSEGV